MRRNDNFMIILVIIMAIISFTCLSLSVSHSYVMRSSVRSNALVITTGNLTSTIDYVAANNIVFTAMSDEEGLSQNNYGTIIISKNNVYSVFYSINIGYATSSIPSGYSLTDLMPLENVKIALFAINGGVVSENPLVGPVRIADLPLYSVDPTSPYNATYTIAIGEITNNNAAQSYAIKAWIDDGTSDAYDEALIYLAVNVDQETLINKSIYNFSGTVVDANDDVVSSAKVSAQNGLNNTVTNEYGEFSLLAIEGTYNLSVEYGNNTYETTIHIRSGNSFGIQQIGPNNAAAGTYLPSLAYQYYTTPYKILSKNNLTNNTNEVASSAYTIPASYVLTGEESISVLPFENIKITLNNNGTLSLSIEAEE